MNRKLKHIILVALLLLMGGGVMAQNDPQFVIMYNGHYLAHVATQVGGHDTIVLQNADAFSPNCLWYSGNTVDFTGTNHNYYFLDGNNYHFLSAPLAPNGALGLSATFPGAQILRNVEQIYYFYNWDPITTGEGGGVARGYQYTNVNTQQACQECNASWYTNPDNGNSECWKVYWVEYKAEGNKWELSSSSSYHITGNGGRFRRVSVNESITPVANTGLLNMTVGGTAATSVNIESGENKALSATINSPYRYTAYTTYTFADGTHNYYNETVGGNSSDHGSSTPTSPNGNTTAVKYQWVISGSGAQYLSFAQGSNLDTVVSTSSPACTLYYRVPNNTGHKTATLTLTVTYADGSKQTLPMIATVKTPCDNPLQASAPVVTYDGVTVSWVNTSNQYKIGLEINNTWHDTIELGNVSSYTFTGLAPNTEYQYRVTAYCNGAYLDPGTAYSFKTKEAPELLVKGAVFGGGRMADVTGNTEVVVINCDSIGAIYGGNDIAGTVHGLNGSKIILGVDASTDDDSYAHLYNNNQASTKVRVNDVYGGGNGYYAYGGTTFEAISSTTTSVTLPAGASVNALSASNEWNDPVWTNPTTAEPASLTIPSILKTAITVTNNQVKIDSLFGGAKNAFLTAGSGNGDTIAINGGTVFAVFGGNNVGGGQGYGIHRIHVTNTTTDLNDSIVNTATTGFGRDFGIRYLYGGGNKVKGSTTNISIVGGQLDTIFGGGNSADVYASNVTVNCSVASGSSATFGNTYSEAIDSYSEGVITTKDDYEWDGFSGIYNVRTLFGGNNQAPMNGVPHVNLLSGSVGTVYGGGNAGDMMAHQDGVVTLDGSDDIHMKYSTHVEMNSPTMLVDYLYGGCQVSNVDFSTWVEIKGGHVGTAYGGCNVSGDVGSSRLNPDAPGPKSLDYQAVQGATYVKATGGIVHKNLFAGSNGFYHCNDGMYYITSSINYGDPEGYYIGLPIPTHNETHVVVDTGAVVNGNVYAGGNLAPVGFTDVTAGGKPFPHFVGLASVRMSGGTVNGDVYGGGNMAAVLGSNEVRVLGGAIDGALYGGNDRLGMMAQISNRILPDEYSVASDGYTSLEDLGIRTYVGVSGRPAINTVYGGGNGAYNYNGTAQGGDMDYCNPGDQPIQGYTFVDIHIDGDSPDASTPAGHINTVYGGGNGVTVNGAIYVFLDVKNPNESEHIGTIFGGNNMGDLALVPDIILLKGNVGTVYGGCNQGAMTGYRNFTFGGTTYNNIGSMVRLRNEYVAANSAANPTTHTTIPTAKVLDAVYGGCRMNGVNGENPDTHQPVATNTLVLVEAGSHSANFFGGSDISGNVSGISQVVVNGGTVGNVYGGGNGNYYYDGNKVYDINDHSILIDTSDVNITAPVCAVSQVDIMKGNVGTGTGDSEKADVFGGGLGASTSTTGNVTVTIGTDTASAVTYCPIVYGDIYGGSALGSVNTNASNTTTVDIINGTVRGNVYGGGLGYAEVNSTTGYLVPNSTETSIEAIVNGTVHVNIGDATLSANPNYENFVNVNKVFGGNNLAGSPQAKVYVDVYRTEHTSANEYPSPVPASSALTNTYYDNHAYAINEVYGGGNLANYSPVSNDTSTYVHIHNCDNTIGYVYGGGNAARVPASKVIIDGGLFNYVFGGGNGYGDGNPGANVSDNDTIVLNGGLIGYVYGGSNARGTVYGETSLQFKETPDCNRSVNELYGGGNQADDADGITLNIPCGTDGVKVIYGGANQANVGTSETPANVVLNVNGGELDTIYGGNNQDGIIYGNVTLNLHGGTINKAFGGNNAGGDILGIIEVNVLDTCTACPLNVNTVYGGGNMAAYSPTDATISSPQVNVIHGTVNDAVYGGGMGSGATVNANPVVTIGDSNALHAAIVGANLIGTSTPGSGNVYGGGDAAAVNGSTTLVYQDTHSQSRVNRLFGGGNQASITKNDGATGATTINMNSGKVLVGIYGGCNAKGNVKGVVAVNVTGGTLGTSDTETINIFGGGYGGYQNPDNPGTSTDSLVNVTIGTNAGGTTAPIIYGNVYGGSAFGSVNNGNDDVTKVWVKSGLVNGRVYGGGLGDADHAAAVNGGVQVIVDDGEVTTAIYGCNDQNGAPQDTVNVTVNNGLVANVVGGGNEADYGGTPKVYIKGGEVAHRVIGGGKQASVGGTMIVMTDGLVGTGTHNTETDPGIFGGCNDSGTVTGHVEVNILGGTIGTQTNLNNEILANIHGGGYGAATRTTGNVTVNFGTDAGGDNSEHSDFPMLYGDLYGGSALGWVNDGSTDSTNVNILNGSIKVVKKIVGGEVFRYGGAVYGGGLGDESHAALVNGKVHVNIGGVTQSGKYIGKASLIDCDIYGCNNEKGSPQEDVFVDVYQTAHTPTDSASYTNETGRTYAMHYVFGGGNQADYHPESNPGWVKKTHNYIHGCDNTAEIVYAGGNAADCDGVEITVDGGRFNYVFAGGNGEVTAANIGEGSSTIHLRGGLIGWYFKGCNLLGTIGGTIVEEQGCSGDDCCDVFEVEKYFFGANQATIYIGIESSIECGDDTKNYKYVYAGSRLAVVYGDIKLTVRGGEIGTIFGGSEGNERISADVRKYPSDWDDIDNFPANHQQGLRDHFSDPAHEGDYGKGGNIILTLEGGQIGNIFGGCDFRGLVEGDIIITIDSNQVSTCGLDINYIYGGNNLAEYAPRDPNRDSPKVLLKNGHVNGAIFGGSMGGNPDHHFGNGKITSNPKVVIGDPSSTNTVKVGGMLHSTTTPTQGEGDVFGGGRSSDVKGNPHVIIQGKVNIKNNVLGGGKNGNVDGDTKVTIHPTESK